jgi:hypothetical protein
LDEGDVVMRKTPFGKWCGVLSAAAMLASVGAVSEAQTTMAVEDWTPPPDKALAASDAKTSAAGDKAEATSRPAPAVKIAVTEWVILVADQYLRQVNRMESIGDTLPSFIDERRTPPAEKENASAPMPIGVIRFTATGPLNQDDRFDVSLNYKDGRALGSWPPANVRSSGILWQDLKWQTGADAGAAMPIPDNSWIAPLRSGDRRLQLKSVAEPFLLYDVELEYPVSLKVTGGAKGVYNVVQPMDAPVHDLTFYQQGSDGHWKTGTLPTLAKTAGSSMVAAPEAPTTAAAGRRVFLNTANGPVQMVMVNGKLVPLQKTPTTAPATTQPHGTELTLADSPATGENVLAPWGTALGNAGVSSSDQKVALAILAKYALTPDRLTAVYRMDPAELEKVMPLEVVPQPEKITRIALVVVTGIDPKIQDELDDWIAKLGSKSWTEREASMAKLKKMGAIAKERLVKATKDKDMEIVYRAEQLLEGM